MSAVSTQKRLCFSTSLTLPYDLVQLAIKRRSLLVSLTCAADEQTDAVRVQVQREVDALALPAGPSPAVHSDIVVITNGNIYTGSASKTPRKNSAAKIFGD